MTLKEAHKEFIEWGAMRYSQSTVVNYRGLIARFVEYNGDCDIEQLSIMDITNYFMYLKKKNYHDSSIAFSMIALRQMFKMLFLRGELSWNYELIGIPKYVSKSYRPIGNEEMQKMIEKVKGKNFSDLRDKTILSFLHSSGVRNSELCMITLPMLEIENRVAIIVSKKNKVIRRVFWDKRTGDLLAKYILAREQYATTDYLFIGNSSKNPGGKLSTRAIQRIFKKYRIREDAVPHGCRHGLGERSVEADIHPRFIQTILGHKNLNSQQVYTQVKDKEVVKAYKKIDSIS